MIDEKDARLAASASTVLPDGMRLGAARELSEGWYFPFVSDVMVSGSSGVIVNKRSGKLFHLGSAFPVERDLELYDRWYQFDSYDLVILDVHDRKQTVHALGRLHVSVLEPRTEYGTVRQVPRRVTSDELSNKLDQLPCILPAIRLYFEAEEGPPCKPPHSDIPDPELRSRARIQSAWPTVVRTERSRAATCGSQPVVVHRAAALRRSGGTLLPGAKTSWVSQLWRRSRPADRRERVTLACGSMTGACSLCSMVSRRSQNAQALAHARALHPGSKFHFDRREKEHIAGAAQPTI